MGSERRERMKALGMRLRGLRAEAGLTGAVLAQRAGVGQPTVSKVENGRMVPSFDVLDRLSRALDLDDSSAREVRDLLVAVEAAADAELAPDDDGAAGAVLDDAVRSARLVRSFQCVVLPAMLQSAEYARQVFQSAPNSTSETVGRAVAARVERQSVLYEPGRGAVFVFLKGRPDLDPPQPPHIAVWRSVRRSGDTKTRKSRRTLALPARCVDALWQQFEDQGWDRLAADEEWEEHGLVFSSAVGKPLDAANVRRAFRQALKGIEGINADEWTPRELRHSFVSLLSDRGVPLEEISRLVGHSGTAATEEVDRKQIRPVIQTGAVVMDGIFGTQERRP
ncbi:Scr1 family TA system antitoxin-like transcriptional regulator [Streptomyces collinus]|uniref:Scr1 family TA system antitoxin-like transcriptional regulator n=1 Tax=Streptomyces collinus TaxID=42684 RepID=UPI0036E002ED